MKKETCAISIIVPVYNTDEKFFSDCIESIIAQDFEDFEVLVVDDGSSSEYVDGINRITQKDERICLIRQENAGVSSARNIAMAQSRGEYIAFVDADDVLLPYFLSDSYQTAIKHSADFVVGCVYRTANVQEQIEHMVNPKVEIFSENDVRKFAPYFFGVFCSIGKGGINRGPVAKLVKRELACQYLFMQDMKIGEDGLWILQVLNRTQRLCFVPQVWYLYRINPMSATCRYNPEIINQVEPYLKRIPEYIDFSSDKEYFAYVARIYEFLWLMVYRAYLAHDVERPTFKERRKAIRYLYTADPWRLIGGWKFISLASGKKKICALLYKSRLLFLSWDIKRKLKLALRG